MDTDELPDVPVNHVFFCPDSGIHRAMNAWPKNGATHHEVLFLGDWRNRLRLLCEMLDIKRLEV